MHLNRRHVLAGLGGAAVAGLPAISLAQSSLTLGAHEVISVSDGNLVLPGALFFDGLPAEPLSEILAAKGLSADQLTPPCNLTLLRSAERLVLFDAGSGAGFMPSAGRLLDSLAAIDVAPEDITDVVFTHAHPDHLWGILDDFDDPVFPDANLMIGQGEWDYWTDPDTLTNIDEAFAGFVVGAARRLEAVEDQLSFIRGGQEILPGVLAHDTPGHTPGHMSFELRDGADAVLVGGDAIGNHHIAFARPDWPSGTDLDTDLGIATRRRLLDQLARDQMPLLGFHLPGGGLGRVERAGDAYRFAAMEG